MCYDHQRIKAGRFDMFCCFKTENPAKARSDIIRRWYTQSFVPFVFRKSGFLELDTAMRDQ